MNRLKIDNILVYHWKSWTGFLISHLVADYCHLEADYGDDINSIERYLTPNIEAVLLQINLSNSAHFPARRKRLISDIKLAGIKVLNTTVDDISKRNLHRLLRSIGLPSAAAEQQGPSEQMLFIKSNLNWGGIAEQRLDNSILARMPDYEPATIKSWDAYYTIRRADINPILWLDTSIVIESYIENSENSFYRVYGCGESIVIVKAHTADLIKKISGHFLDKNFTFTKSQIMESMTDLDFELQKTISIFIKKCPLFYFCLDIVHNTKKYYIIDLNLTPYSGVNAQDFEAVNFLRRGGQLYLQSIKAKELIEL